MNTWFGVTYNTFIVTLGVMLLGASAGLVGCFAVLRKRSLTGDALAHAALPGVCVAFLLVGDRSLGWMLVGAFLAGLLGINIITALRGYTRVQEDAANGVVLSVFYGAGVVLVRLIQDRWVGEEGATRAGLDTYILGQAASMIEQDVYLIGGASLISLLLMLILYKEFKLVAFDPGFAKVQGWPALRLDLLLMGLVALAVVVGLPAVGVVMIAALLILPGVTARFWTDRLGTMLALSVFFGMITGLIGATLSARYSLMPTGPIVILVGGAFFFISALAAPRRGLISRVLAQRRFQLELEERNLLRVLYELGELGGAKSPHRSEFTFDEVLHARSWTPRKLARVQRLASQQGYLEPETANGFALTEAGLHRASQIVRGYRLWELFLTEYPDQASGLVDLASESVDEVLPAPMVAELTAKLRQAGRWPVANMVRVSEVA